MLYWLIQVSALLLLAYFLGALIGCSLRRLFSVDQPRMLDQAGLAPAAASATVAPAVIRGPTRDADLRPEVRPRRIEIDETVERRAGGIPPAPTVSDAITEAYEAGVVDDLDDDEAVDVAAPVAATPKSVAPIAIPPVAVSPASPAVIPPAPVATAVRPDADDLKRIRGIGPDIEEQLNQLGIWRFAEIASWKAGDVARVGETLAFHGRISREGWIEQAQILARGGDTAFSRRIDRGDVGNIMRAAWSTTTAARALDDLVAPADGPDAGDELPDAVAEKQADAEAARLVNERSEALRLQREADEAQARERVERETRAAAEADRLQQLAAHGEQERLQSEAREHQERQRAVAQREAAERAERERLAEERALKERQMGEQAARDQAAREQAAREQAAREQAAREQAAREQAAREQAERAAQERSRLEAAERQRQAREAEQAARAERDRLEREALARQDMERAAAEAAALALATGAIAAASKAKAEPAQRPAATATASAVKPETRQDDLKRIRSIDSDIEQALRGLGITRYEQIAALGPDDVDAVNARIGAQGRVEQENWVEQAQVLAKGIETSYARQLRENNERSLRAKRAQLTGASATVGTAAVTPAGANSGPAGRARTDTSALRSVRSERLVGDRREEPRSAPTAEERGGRVLRAVEADDLKRIRGVGVVLEKKLFGLGITSYAQIAAWTADDIARVNGQLSFSGRIEREGWIEQAQVLARGGETAFSRRVDRGEVDSSRSDES